MQRQTRDILLAFIISVAIHAGFFALSNNWYFGGFGDLSQDVKQAFQVKIQPKEEQRLVRQPRPDIEAKRREIIREKIKTHQTTIPELAELPPLSVNENVEENLQTTLTQSVRQKIRDEQKKKQLPELLTHSTESPVSMDLLEMARDVGRQSPAIQRRKLNDLDGTADSDSAYTGTLDSSLMAVRDSAPQIAAAPGQGVPGIMERKWSPGLLPPKPVIDLSRDVEQPPEIPHLYIKPDRVKEYVSLDQFLSVELYTYHVPGDPRGYFMVRIRPNEKSKELPVMNKDIIFVLDASASMGRRTLSVLKTALKLCLTQLREDDYFNVIGFKRNIIEAEEGLQPAIPRNIQDSLSFVDGLEPSGRTDIYGSLKPISQLARGQDHPFIIFLFSDGRPNVGVVDSREIINDLSSNLRENSSIFTFGAGGKMNKYLLDMLSYRNKGFVEFSNDYSTIVDEVDSMFQAVSDPLLINLQGDYGNISREDVFPKTLPDLYRGGEILVFGRYSNEKKFSLRISGEARAEQKEFVMELDFPDEDNGPENLPQLWAFRKIYDLIGLMCKEGETPQRLAEIQRISEAYSIKTPYYE